MTVRTALSCASAFALCPGLRMLPLYRALSASVLRSGLDERLENSRIACAQRCLAARKSATVTKVEMAANRSFQAVASFASLALPRLAYSIIYYES